MKMIPGYLKMPLFIFLFSLSFFKAAAQVPKLALQSNPWKEEQLIRPEALMGMITQKADLQIYNIGIVQNIKGAVNLGAASETENLEKLKDLIKTKDKNDAIVIYCGCCPMDRCPNIRPAFKLFMDQKFSNVRLLELPVNIKVNWIDKGYPID